MDKKIAQRIHAKRRAAERYGLTVNRHVQREWVLFIQAGKAHKIEDQSLRVGVYLIQHEGQPIKVVYDRNRKTIVTCLPLKQEAEKQEENIN